MNFPKEKKMENERNAGIDDVGVSIIDESTIRDRIHTVRGVKVMLDFDLAQIYGYTTKAFNQQVKNNVSKFPGDFRFRLTKEEAKCVSRSSFLTLNGADGRGSASTCSLTGSP